MKVRSIDLFSPPPEVKEAFAASFLSKSCLVELYLSIEDLVPRIIEELLSHDVFSYLVESACLMCP